ncbi:MAG TPA: DUF1801 domain-containing protein [Chloroflexia bacterium]|jgi:hypothetical protein
MSYASPDEGFNEILASATPKVRDLALQARELIRDVMPDIVEVPWPRQRIAGYGVGPKKMTEHFCYISVHKNHIDLGFNYGSELPDPDGLLQGTGKLFRHLKITTPEDLTRPAVRHLLEAASTHRMPSRAQAQ